MPDSVIVTIRYGAYQYDMELPLRVPMVELYGSLLKVLKTINPSVFSHYKAILLLHNGKALADQKSTLLDYGIASGMYVDVVGEV